ncbi:MAG: hypothetical protein QXF01_01110 [Candidatus Micrarchaeaceae archaeon]
MAKNQSSKEKKLEALERAQQINKALEASTIENAALLSSAGEDRPTIESHVIDLLNNTQQLQVSGGESQKGSGRFAKKKTQKKRKN